MDHNGILGQSNENARLAAKVFRGSGLEYTGGSAERWNYVAQAIDVHADVYLETGDVVAYRLPIRNGEQSLHFKPLELRLGEDTAMRIMQHQWESAGVTKQRKLYTFYHNLTKLVEVTASDRAAACYEVATWLKHHGYNDLLNDWYTDGRPLNVNGVLITDKMVGVDVRDLQGRLF